MHTDLLIPLAGLPGPVPEGAPVVATQDATLFLPAAGDWRIKAGWRGTVLGGDHIGWCDEDGKATLLWDIAEDCGVRLDLSRPPADANGWPTRVDGFDVAAALLARAMGLDPAGGVIWRRIGRSDWRLSVREPGGQQAGSPSLDQYERRFVAELLSPALSSIQRMEGLWVAVPALADIDPKDPDADRLALVAVIKAKP